MTKEELYMRKLVRESDFIDKTDGSEAAEAFRYLWEKYIEHEPCRDMEEIREIMNCDADAETKCRMISDILTAPPHYFEMPCENTVTREVFEQVARERDIAIEQLKELGYEFGKKIEQESKIGHCKDCKWWRDSDGSYRRGIGAESRCPINRREVFEGNGYCYVFKPKEQE